MKKSLLREGKDDKAYETFDEFNAHKVNLSDKEKKLVADAEKNLKDDVYAALWNDDSTLKMEKTTLDKVISFMKKLYKSKLSITENNLKHFVASINAGDIPVIMKYEFMDNTYQIVLGLEKEVR